MVGDLWAGRLAVERGVLGVELREILEVRLHRHLPHALVSTLCVCQLYVSTFCSGSTFFWGRQLSLLSTLFLSTLCFGRRLCVYASAFQLADPHPGAYSDLHGLDTSKLSTSKLSRINIRRASNLGTSFIRLEMEGQPDTQCLARVQHVSDHL